MSNSDKEKIDLSALSISRTDSHPPLDRAKYFRLSLWLIVPLAFIIALWLVLKGISPAVEVRITTAAALTQNQAQAVLSATGYVVARRSAEVASKATGRLEYIGVEEGDEVKAGQVIARLESADMQAALDQAKAMLERIRAESTEAAINFGRQKELLAAGFLTKAEFDIAEARFKGLAAEVRSAAAAVKQAEVSLENTTIRAPFDGTVLNKYADVGEIVAPFSSSAGSRGAVVVLADMSSLEVEADVAEAHIRRINLGQECEIILDAYPEKRYRGFVKKIVPTADRSRATVMTRVGFLDRDDQVLPEMSARINFLRERSADTLPAQTTAMVPNSAVVSRDGGRYCFLVVEGKAEMVPVTTGRRLGEQTEITSGVVAGQKVILSPPSNLKPKTKVKIIE